MKQRIFIAIPLPEEIKKEIDIIQSKLKKFDWPVRWEPSEKWHLTLRFLGSLADQELEQVKQIVSQAVNQFKPFYLVINGFVVLPSLEFPRVICLNVNENDRLYNLQAEIANALEEQGIGEPERHLFTGHITLGRLPPVKVNFRALTQIKFDCSFKVKSVEIIESVLTRTGSEYEIVKSYATSNS